MANPRLKLPSNNFYPRKGNTQMECFYKVYNVQNKSIIFNICFSYVHIKVIDHDNIYLSLNTNDFTLSEIYQHQQIKKLHNLRMITFMLPRVKTAVIFKFIIFSLTVSEAD